MLDFLFSLLTAILECEVKNKKPIKTILKVLCLVCLVIIVIAAILFFLLTRRPAVYQPIDLANSEEISPYLTHYLAPDLYNKLQLDKPFELIVTQDGFNDIIARGEWPATLSGVTFSKPATVINPGQILVMGTIEYVRIPMVVTIDIQPKLHENGLLELNFTQFKAGSIDITRLAKMLTFKIISYEIENAGPDDDIIWLANLSAAVTDNKPFDPIFPIYGEPMRLTGLKLSEGEAILRFKPE